MTSMAGAIGSSGEDSGRVRITDTNGLIDMTLDITGKISEADFDRIGEKVLAAAKEQLAARFLKKEG